MLRALVPLAVVLAVHFLMAPGAQLTALQGSPVVTNHWYKGAFTASNLSLSAVQSTAGLQQSVHSVHLAGNACAAHIPACCPAQFSSAAGADVWPDAVPCATCCIPWATLSAVVGVLLPMSAAGALQAGSRY